VIHSLHDPTMDQLQQLAPLVEKVYTLVADPKLSGAVNSDAAMAERQKVMNELHMSPPPASAPNVLTSPATVLEQSQPKNSPRSDTTAIDAPPWFKEMLKDPNFSAMLKAPSPATRAIGSQRNAFDEDYAVRQLESVVAGYEQVIQLLSLEVQGWKHTAASLHASLHHITEIATPHVDHNETTQGGESPKSKSEIIAKINALTAQLAHHV
jgi:hypothetical protein